MEKIDRFKNNPENSCTKKVSEHVSSGFSMSIIQSFKSIENEHNIDRAKDCMKTFCKCFREYAIEIINFKKMKFLIKDLEEPYENAKLCYICKEKFKNKYLKTKIES